MGIEERIAERRIAQRKRVKATAVAVLICLVATGCASKYGAQTTQVNYYKECYDPIAQLREAESDFNKTVAAGAILGAVGGAVIGGLVSGKPKGVLAGAAAGAAAGGGLGYVAAKQNQIKDDQKRLESYRMDVGADVEGLDRAMAAATVASDCYEKQFQADVEKFKAGKMSKEEFKKRYAEIKNGMSEASAILGRVSESARKKEEQYSAALASEAAKFGVPVPEPTIPAAVAGAQSEAPATPASPSPPEQAPKPEVKPVAQKAPPKPQPVKTTPAKSTPAQTSPPKPAGTELVNMSNDLQSLKNKTQSAEDAKVEIKNRVSRYEQTALDVAG